MEESIYILRDCDDEIVAVCRERATAIQFANNQLKNRRKYRNCNGPVIWDLHTLRDEKGNALFTIEKHHVI